MSKIFTDLSKRGEDGRDNWEFDKEEACSEDEREQGRNCDVLKSKVINQGVLA